LWSPRLSTSRARAGAGARRAQAGRPQDLPIGYGGRWPTNCGAGTAMS